MLGIAVTSLSLLAASVTASDFGYSCTNETLDATTDVLTAICGTGDGKGTVDTTSINLNECFAYSDGNLYFAVGGNFGESCDDCTINILPDAIYYKAIGLTRPWLNCTCQGTEVSINLDTTRLDNNYGTLTCTD